MTTTKRTYTAAPDLAALVELAADRKSIINTLQDACQKYDDGKYAGDNVDEAIVAMLPPDAEAQP